MSLLLFFFLLLFSILSLWICVRKQAEQRLHAVRKRHELNYTTATRRKEKRKKKNRLRTTFDWEHASLVEQIMEIRCLIMPSIMPAKVLDFSALFYAKEIVFTFQRFCIAVAICWEWFSWGQAWSPTRIPQIWSFRFLLTCHRCWYFNYKWWVCQYTLTPFTNWKHEK